MSKKLTNILVEKDSELNLRAVRQLTPAVGVQLGQHVTHVSERVVVPPGLTVAAVDYRPPFRRGLTTQTQSLTERLPTSTYTCTWLG